MAGADEPDIDERKAPAPGHGGRFVPEGFVPPDPPRTDLFWLEPLGSEHNDADYAAWTSSIAHIHRTPGFTERRWPHPMTLEENLGDLQMHARHFAESQGFTYTVLSSDHVTPGDVIGCVYIYPSDDPAVDASVRSWVRVSHEELDAVLYHLVADWLVARWPFETVSYAERTTAN